MLNCLRVALLGVLPLMLGGCIEFYGYRTVEKTVLDAETGRPIAGATVDVRYVCLLFLNPPSDHSGSISNSDGKVFLKVATTKDCFPGLDVSASGYIPLREPVEVDALRLYAMPVPRVMIAVPNEFRGAFTLVRRRSNQWIQETPGQREFKYLLKPGEQVHLDATPLLWRDRTIDVARTDGRAIPRANSETDQDQIALRGPIDDMGDRSDVIRENYVVGTLSEYQEERTLRHGRP